MFELKVGKTVALLDDCFSHLADVKWKLTQKGYAINYQGERLHRVVLGLKRGDPGVDHINGVKLDCRRENLRLADQATNTRNIDGPNRHNEGSGYLGVTFVKANGTYKARIHVNGANLSLGSYATQEEAHAARLAGEEKYWGIQPRRAHHFKT